jgi:hypothetical protein
VCLSHLDGQELASAAMTADQRAAVDRIYRVDRAALGAFGPSVISINGVVASLAATEAMVMITGLREPVRALTYRADRGGVVIDCTAPNPNCIYCVRYRLRGGSNSASA